MGINMNKLAATFDISMMDDNPENYFQINREHWNKRVPIHRDSGFYDLEGFKKGKSTLNAIELTELGEVRGKRMLHLQCHFGLDSMSWARLGAKVTGVDFSEDAIDLARSINGELGLDAEFICSNVYDAQNFSKDKYDIVFTSYGVIGWLPDLQKWAQIIRQCLKPGGTFYMAEFHPMVWIFDDNFTKVAYSYFNREVIESEYEGTYGDREAAIKIKDYSWNHPISEVVNALISHGMEIRFINEFDYSPYDCFPNTVKNEEGNFYIKGFENKLPMVYSIKAVRSK